MHSADGWRVGGPQADRLHGYGSRPPQAVVAAVATGSDVSSFGGDFVAFGGSGKSRYAISSFLSVLPWYCSLSWDGTLVQGAEVFDLAARRGLPWRWNRRALVSLALFGHTIGSDTLCEGIHRMPPGSRVTVRDGRLETEALPVRPFLWDAEDGIDAAFDQLRSSFRDCVSGASRIHLSLSAGYDSRLLLALCLSEGIAPEVSVMGYGDSTDVLVARALCERIGLPIVVIEPKQSGYLEEGARIARVTSGVKPAAHWHTYLYAAGKSFADGVHLVGSNGEFARSFYFDRPGMNGLADAAPRPVSGAYWRARLLRRYLKFSRHNDLVRSGPGRERQRSLLSEARPDRRWGSTGLTTDLDAFYAEHRVRHFIGSGLACYAAFGSPRSPFLDARWMRAAAAMGRRFKRANRFHRESIQRLHPALAEIPFNREPGGGAGRSYSPFPALAKDAATAELIADSPHLDQWASRSRRLAILGDPRCDPVEERGFWLTLHFAAGALREAGIEAAS